MSDVKIKWRNNKEAPKLTTYRKWSETAEYWNSVLLLIKLDDGLAIGTYEKAKYTDEEPFESEYFDYVAYSDGSCLTAKANEIIAWAYLEEEQDHE